MSAFGCETARNRVQTCGMLELFTHPSSSKCKNMYLHGFERRVQLCCRFIGSDRIGYGDILTCADSEAPKNTFLVKIEK